MPFGLTISLSNFQQQIDYIIHGLLDTIAYQDDIIIFSRNANEHVRQLWQLIKTLLKFNVKIDSSKSIFMQRSIQHLEYMVSEEGIAPDLKKLKPILDAPKPQNHKELRSFLGCVNYYARFIGLSFFSNSRVTVQNFNNGEVLVK